MNYKKYVLYCAMTLSTILSLGTNNAHASSDDVYFDMKDFILIRGEEKIPLKTKELKLLSLFLQHSDELLEYETINEALWEYDEEPSYGSLRTYIKRIRAAIGKEKIETIKNIGYRFVKK